MNSTADAPPASAPVTVPFALAADEVEPPLAIETLNYPNAAQIQQSLNFLLKRGDGNIRFVTCNGSNDIVVKTRVSQTAEFCFDVRAKPGYLTLQLDDTFAIRTHDYPVTASITANGQKTVVKAPADSYVPIGEGNGEARSALVELRVTG